MCVCVGYAALQSSLRSPHTHTEFATREWRFIKNMYVQVTKACIGYFSRFFPYPVTRPRRPQHNANMNTHVQHSIADDSMHNLSI